MTKSNRHRNDIYGDLDRLDEENPPIPAATVCVLRQSKGVFETLMLRKNSKIAFGGMWVFPGGRIEDGDYLGDRDLEQAARRAAVREANEETGLQLSASEMVHLSHWTPPPSTPRRYATWFFVTRIQSGEKVRVDGGEIREHLWVAPGEALTLHAQGEIDLAPPTWVTLAELQRQAGVDQALSNMRAEEPKTYATRIAVDGNGVRVALWEPDAGYASTDADVEGARHRLVLAQGGFEFIQSP